MSMSTPIHNINTAVAGMAGSPSSGGSVSPKQPVPPKNVAFELLFPDSPQVRARLPMRVQIYPHDDTESIVTTVKNFYGLYSGPAGSKGVSFEDEKGNTLIARYENFHDHMVVYVRVFEESPGPSAPIMAQPFQTSPVGDHAEYPPVGAQAQIAQSLGQQVSRPASPSSQRRSMSPGSIRGRSATSLHGSVKKARSQSSKTRASMDPDSFNDAMGGYSSGDGAASSTKEQFGNTDISVENIVEGGRRKRAKFESSELPLFAPPQMPAATSNPSVSPARRIEHHRQMMPFVQPGQNPFTNPRPIQNMHNTGNGFAQPGIYATPGHDRHRSRGSIGYTQNSGGVSGGSGILPTPDPTVGSCMSEEDKDVALQLMRLGDMSNISHGRTSASTMDDTFSGKADAASSTGATSEGDSDSDDEMPPARRQKLDIKGTARPVHQTTDAHFMPFKGGLGITGDDADYEDRKNYQKPPSAKGTTIKHKSSSSMSQLIGQKPPKASKTSNGSKPKKLPGMPNVPVSPMSMPPSRKQSIASTGNMLPPGEEDHPDLSTKPRCQRCRKSKKGCDRQRPCGRCKDAGLSADQCISEDEGNGRKGRFGRHMGVPIKKEEAATVVAPIQPGLLPAPVIAPGLSTMDKNKKRKR